MDVEFDISGRSVILAFDFGCLGRVSRVLVSNQERPKDPALRPGSD
jgi:hypothetical protein